MKKVTWSSHILCSEVLRATEGGHSAYNSLRNLQVVTVCSSTRRVRSQRYASRQQECKRMSECPLSLQRTGPVTNSWSHLTKHQWSYFVEFPYSYMTTSKPSHTSNTQRAHGSQSPLLSVLSNSFSIYIYKATFSSEVEEIHKDHTRNLRLMRSGSNPP